MYSYEASKVCIAQLLVITLVWIEILSQTKYVLCVVTRVGTRASLMLRAATVMHAVSAKRQFYCPAVVSVGILSASLFQ